MSRHAIALLITATMSVFAAPTDTEAGIRTKRCISNRLRCCIPKKYGYSNTVPGARAIAESLQAVPLPATTTTGTLALPARKTFTIPEATAGRIHMSSPAATIYASGLVRFSCRLNYVTAQRTTGQVGIPAGRAPSERFDVIPNQRCVIRVRGISRTGEGGAGTVLFDASQPTRVVSNDVPVSFQIAASDANTIARHFDEISHLIVDVQAFEDR